MSLFDKALRLITYIGIFAVPFTPLIVANSMFFPFITGKSFFFRIIIAVLVASWLLLCLRHREYRPRYSHVLGSGVAFLIIIFLANIFGLNPEKSFWSNFERMEGFLLLLHLGGCFLVFSSVMSVGNLWWRFVHTWLGVGAFLGFYGIIQLSGELVINQGGVRLDGTFGNASYLAIFMVFMFFFTLLSLSGVKEKSYRLSLLLQSLTVGLSLFILFPFYRYFDTIQDVIRQVGGIPEGYEYPDIFLGKTNIWLFAFSITSLLAVIATYFYKRSHGRNTKNYGFISAGLAFIGSLSLIYFATGNYYLTTLSVLLVALFGISLNLLRSRGKFDEGLSDKIVYCLYTFFAITFATMLFHTATRGAILGLILGLLLAALLVAIFGKNKSWRKVSLISFIAILAGIGTFLLIKDNSYVQNHQVLSRFASIKIIDEGQSRYYIWPMAIEGFKARPILGYGQENFNYVFNEYYNPSLYNQEQWFDRTHNVILDWLIAGGIFGLISYLALFFFTVYYLWTAHKDSVAGFWQKIRTVLFGRRQDEHIFSVPQASIITGLLSAYFFHNLFVFDNLISYVLFVSLLGYVHISVTENKEPIIADGRISDQSYRYFALPIITAVLIVGVYFIDVKGIVTSRTLISALMPQRNGVAENVALFKKAYASGPLGHQEVVEQIVNAVPKVIGSDASPAVKTRMTDSAIEAIGQETIDHPNDTRLHLFKGLMFSYANDYKKATESLQRAVELSPSKQSLRVTLGSLYFENGEREEAFEQFKKAYELAPRFTEPMDYYIAGAVYTGRLELAESLTQELIDIYDNGGALFRPSQRVLNAFADMGRIDLLVPILEKAVEDYPKDLNYNISLASAYFETGDKEAAIVQLEKAKEISPSQASQFDYYINEIRSGRTP